MNLLKIQLKALLCLLKETKTEYVIIGGLAVSLYGEPRATFDIDVNVLLAKENLDYFLKISKKYGFYPIPSQIKSFIKKTAVIPMEFRRRGINNNCDIIIAENPIEIASIKRGKIKNLWSLKVRFVTPEDLIIHKLTSNRPKDLEDARSILMRQDKLDIKYIRNWLRLIEKTNSDIRLVSLFDSLVKTSLDRNK